MSIVIPLRYAACCSHTPTLIQGFFGEFRWLSNMWETPVEFEGIRYPSAENAYQAAKVVCASREEFRHMKPWEAKKAWKRFDLLPEWDTRKLLVMQHCLASKFELNLELRAQLVATGNRELVEGNNWRDTFWGYDVNLRAGTNHLGKLLMEIRTALSPRVPAPGCQIHPLDPKRDIALGSFEY